jgi:hypothetical protein
MIAELKNFQEKNSNPYYQQEKDKLLNLLNNYCSCYKKSYNWFQKVNQLDNNIEIIKENIANFKDRGKYNEIHIYNEYPYIKTMVDNRESNPINPSIVLPNQNTPCN